ncbi:RNA recognition motif domain-containing protein [Chitinophaga deserti]|uniref:RNA recognition motif domain-containing protein n=1 Tax=Chitinophaga deserti TaxID=2164099 RepID=UPI000D6B22C6|nr:RNA-binding protein [Chitinophaga deserti]
MNIYVGNLSSQTTEQEISKVFASYGEVRSVKVIIDAYTGRSKGFAFVEMPETDNAEKAIRELNNTNLDAKYITVNEARPKVERNRYSGY